ncbi:MAG TPA: hypothetical protein VGF69_12605 [Thermoanaerobaculia bacterium]|jgi:hypothetical protein
MRTFVIITIFSVLLAGPAALGQTAEEPIRIPLDATGVADWSYLNPSNLQTIGSRAVLFENTTPDRTFIVSIPFTFTAEERSRVFAAARLQRGGSTLGEIVCGSLTGAAQTTCLSPDTLDLFDRVEELRVLIESLQSVTEPPADITQCESKSPACLVDRLYWLSLCELCRKKPSGDRRTAFDDIVRNEAKSMVLRLIENTEPSTITLCELAAAVASTNSTGFITAPADEPDCNCPERPAPHKGDLDGAMSEVGATAFRKQFAADRIRIARAALIEAATKEATDMIAMPELNTIRTADASVMRE